MPAALDEIVALGRRLGVALSDEDLHRIAQRLGRLPTSSELFAFDAQWSEHCSYKSSRSHLRKLPTESRDVILGVGEDAGIVRLGEWQGETYGLVVAHESHNHPSQVVPFEGAATGVGGIVRDVLCMGAELIGLADMLRFGRREDAHARYVAQSVVDGIAAYGNAIGVPMLAGDTFFDASFDENVLVNVIALGLVKEKEIIRSRVPEGADGWDIVLVGKATDRSGFRGASFASLVLDEDDAEQNKGAVQVPDPFLKNVLMRATYAVFAELRRLRIDAAFKDLGAGGLAGCSAEPCAAGGAGAEIELERVAVAERDLAPEVIAVGETQERLCWVVPPSFTPTLLEIYNDVYALPRIARGACAGAIGKVTATARYVAKYRGEVVIDVPLDFLTAGVRYERPYELVVTVDEPAEARRRALVDAAARRPASLFERLRAVAGHRDVCSRAPIFERYDGVVRGCTALPVGYADAGVLVPIPGAPLAVAVGVGGNPRYGAIDAAGAAELAVTEAVAQVLAVGATPVALTDCCNFGDPTIPAQMGAFVAAIEGLARAAEALGLPFVSGNVSLYNRAANGAHVAPSALVACVGTMAEIAMRLTPALKRPDSTLYVLSAGLDADGVRRCGGSVLADIIGVRSSALPRIAYDALPRLAALLQWSTESGTIVAARDISDGGPLMAAAEMALASLRAATAVGFTVDAGDADAERECALFDEAPGFVVEVPRERDAEFRAVAGQVGVPLSTSFACHSEPALHQVVRGELRAALPIDALREAWEAPLRDFYEDAA
ncbi:MAG: phosphoribosylformylglycinamidine synthase subunit PurL [Candidatus Eremiobacteraeota bacterium]|nr:phosphoribosylformylglycinamidine synthase subunit PurL [Candidatus Eremiobacteraeota bacterium]